MKVRRNKGGEERNNRPSREFHLPCCSCHLPISLDRPSTRRQPYPQGWGRFPLALGTVAQSPGARGVGALVLRRWETAVTSCAGAKGLVRRTLFGTPCEPHSFPLPPVM